MAQIIIKSFPKITLLLLIFTIIISNFWVFSYSPGQGNVTSNDSIKKGGLNNLNNNNGKENQKNKKTKPIPLPNFQETTDTKKKTGKVTFL